MLWPAAVQLAPPGTQLLPLWTSKKVLVELSSFARAMAWKNAGRIGTHSPQKGAARATIEAGVSFAQPSKLGRWHSSAFDLLLDLGQGKTQSKASMVIGAPDDEKYCRETERNFVALSFRARNILAGLRLSAEGL